MSASATPPPPSIYPRRKTIAVQIGDVVVGGDSPIVVQAMTDTDTADDLATAIQCYELFRAGAEMVRIAVNAPKAAQAVAKIRERLAKMCDAPPPPLIGDFHYNGHKLLSRYPECAEALDKYRINPGNIGLGEKREGQFAQMIEIACRLQKPIRIGVNWGSLDESLLSRLMDENARRKVPEDSAAVTRRALVESAIESAKEAMRIGMPEDKIILSAKVSRAPDLIAVYESLASQSHHPLHLGLTEAGMGMQGVASSAAAMGVLLARGIGDTLRVSLTPPPQGDRCDEVRAAWHILQSMGIRARAPTVTACPGCGRTTSAFFRELAADIESHIAEQMSEWRIQYPGAEKLTVAVMGCVVNGPGESRHADIGISLPGSGERPVAPVFADGKKIAVLKGDSIADEFKQMLSDYISRRFGGGGGDGRR